MPDNSYLAGAATPRTTPQSEPIPGSTQVPNSAGGHAWELDAFERFRRWLVLGSEGGSYYAGERDLTRASTDVVRTALDEQGAAAVELIVEVSREGRAPRNDEAIYALAVAAGHSDPDVRYIALDVLPLVCRTGTHLFQFMEFVKGQRGRGRALNSAVARWYTEQAPEKLAYQLVKYRQRGGWTHGDVLRLVRPKPPTAQHDMLFRMAVKGVDGYDGRHGEPPAPATAYVLAQVCDNAKGVVALIKHYGSDLPREALPQEHLADPDVMAALVDHGMPYTALMRNLGNLTRTGAVKPLTQRAQAVAARLADADAVRKARVHPLNVLKALATYRAGEGLRGSGAWQPVPEIVDALDRAFYAAFTNVSATGKRHLLALDVSASMTWGTLAGSALTPRDGSAAMALVTMAVGDPTLAMAFSGDLHPLAISAGQRVDDAVRAVSGLSAGSTDCSLPMRHALAHDLEVDVFVVYTDNETWAGPVHPAQALAEYRRRTGIDAKLVVVGMVANEFTIADPADSGMLDVVGFDAAAPSLIAEFAAGQV